MRVLNVQKLIDQQSTIHKERSLSQFSRLLDSTPSFVTYYSIDGINSTAELGTRDIMQYVGNYSPVKFKKIINMPMYALDVINAEITYDDILGTYTEHEGEALVLESVLMPLPGDHFVIPAFNAEIIFIVTESKIRAIRGKDHYVISYSLVTSSRQLKIERQVQENYETLFRNIGTEDKVLIKKDDYNLLRDLTDVYSQITQRYIDEFYDKHLGYLKTPESIMLSNHHGTCKYLINYLSSNRILFFDEVLENMFALEQVLPFEAKHNKLYQRTFPLLKFINRSLSSNDVYINYKGLSYSLFKDYYDAELVQSVEFIYTDASYTPIQDRDILLFNKSFIDNILNMTYSTLSPLELVIAKFYNGETITSSEYSSIVDDYMVDDVFRMYFIPLALTSMKILIKSIQSGTFTAALAGSYTTQIDLLNKQVQELYDQMAKDVHDQNNYDYIYAYNPDGSIATVTEQDVDGTVLSVASFSYLADGSIDTMTKTENGVTTVTKYTYDANGNIYEADNTIQ